VFTTLSSLELALSVLQDLQELLALQVQLEKLDLPDLKVKLDLPDLKEKLDQQDHKVTKEFKEILDQLVLKVKLVLQGLKVK
jgi:hypothetical protein